MTNLDRLDQGSPPLPVPVEVTDDALRYGNALAGLWGTEAAPTDFGTLHLLSATILSNVAVVANRTTVGPGTVLAVEATAATATGPKTLVLTMGAMAAERVVVSPQANGSVSLQFFGADAVTEISVYLLAAPSALRDHLAAEENPPP